MIKPTVGRVVWYRDAGSDPAADPHAALVVLVHGDSCVNLVAFNGIGIPYSAQSVLLVQDGDATPDASTAYAEWMPFQKGQAAKAEQAQVAVAGTSTAPVNVDLAPVHAKIDELVAKVEQIVPPMPQDLQPVHDEMAELQSGVHGKFQELGDWLTVKFTHLEQRIETVANHPALEIPPIAPADPAPPLPQG